MKLAQHGWKTSIYELVTMSWEHRVEFKGLLTPSKSNKWMFNFDSFQLLSTRPCRPLMWNRIRIDCLCSTYITARYFELLRRCINVFLLPSLLWNLFLEQVNVFLLLSFTVEPFSWMLFSQYACTWAQTFLLTCWYMTSTCVQHKVAYLQPIAKHHSCAIYLIYRGK
jgi:hypothetical protein